MLHPCPHHQHHNPNTPLGFVLNRAMNLDPTRTTSLRKAFMGAMVKRFRWLKGQINGAIIKIDVFGMSTTPLGLASLALVPGEFKFKTTAGKVDGFMSWLREKQDEGVLEVTKTPGGRAALDKHWTDVHVRRAYERGVKRGRAELRKRGYELGPDSPIQGWMNQPMHADRLGMLYSRTFSELKGITEAMDQQISRELTEGLARGDNPLTIARHLNNRVDKIGIVRARTLARTEVIRAHHVANVAEYRAAGLEGVKVKAEWSTAGYKVCPVCSDMEGHVFTLDKIEGMIPAHPNCRCIALPVLPTDKVVEKEKGSKQSAPPIPKIRPKDGDMLLEDLRATLGNKMVSERTAYKQYSLYFANSKTPRVDFRKFYNRAKWEVKNDFVKIPEVQKVILPKRVAKGSPPRERVVRAKKLQKPLSDVITKKERDAIYAWEEDIPLVSDIRLLQMGQKVENYSLAQVQSTLTELESVANKAPKHTGTVYRGVKADVKMRVGEEHTIEAFSSSTKSMETAKYFANVELDIAAVELKDYKGPKTIFKYITRSGIDISSVSSLPEQSEVLLSKGTKFRVRSVAVKKLSFEGRAFRVKYIQLEEVVGPSSKNLMGSAKSMSHCLFGAPNLSTMVATTINNEDPLKVGLFEVRGLVSVRFWMMDILEDGIHINVPQACSDYVRKGKSWMHKGRDVTEGVAERAKKLGVPPGWKNVVLSADPLAKVQAIGMDAAGRWQYRYSAAHIAESAQKKFNRIKEFSMDLPSIRRRMAADVAKGDHRAMLLRMEDKTAIRAGSAKDFKAKKKAYGLTTLKNEHAVVRGNKVTLKFVAKEGIPAHYEFTDDVLAAWVKERKAATSVGQDLFDVPAQKLNKYVQSVAGGKKYTIKDYRTYHGTRIATEKLKEHVGKALTASEKKEVVKGVCESVSAFLRNTPLMAKKSYIDPMVWEMIGGL